MNGSVKKYPTANGERWWVRWDLPDGPAGQRRQRSKRGFKTKAEAAKFLRHVLSEQDHGRPVERSTETVAQAVESYLAAKRAAGVRPTTFDLWSTNLRTHVVPRIGGMKVTSLRAEQVGNLYAELAHHGKANGKCRTSGITCSANVCDPDHHDGLGPTAVRHVASALRAALRHSLGDGVALPTDTSRARASLPRRTSSDRRVQPGDYWSDDEARRFLAATADHPMHAAFALALATGMRRAELAGLRWEDVTTDGDSPALRITRSITVVRGKAVARDGGKTDAAERTVPLGSGIAELLRKHRQQQRAARLAAESWEETGHVFTDATGQPLNPRRLTDAFTVASEGADLPRVGLHGARHYAITAMLRRGVPVPTVARIVGHGDASVTLRVYAHAIPADDRLAADALNAALYGIVAA